MAKAKKEGNYLDNIPAHSDTLTWEKGEDGAVTLNIENRGFFNRAAQLIFKKPKVSHIHLDEIGSFLWCEIDGKRTLLEIAEPFGEHFGERVEPRYERMCEFVRTLHSYGFISFVSTDKKTN